MTQLQKGLQLYLFVFTIYVQMIYHINIDKCTLYLSYMCSDTTQSIRWRMSGTLRHHIVWHNAFIYLALGDRTHYLAQLHACLGKVQLASSDVDLILYKVFFFLGTLVSVTDDFFFLRLYTEFNFGKYGV